jgi:hypothetical protein
MSISSMPNRQNKHINITTSKKDCKRPTQQYGITKYAEKNS